MKRYLIRTVLTGLLACVSAGISWAADGNHDALTRDEIISRQLDCLSSRQDLKEKGEVDWADVCAIRDTDVSASDPTDDVLGELDEYDYDDDLLPAETSDHLHPLFSRDNKNSTLEMGIEAYDFKYTEPQFMKDNGYMYGINGAYTYRWHENKPVKSWGDLFSNENGFNMLRLDGRVVYGTVDYQSEGTGTLDNIKDYAFELRGVLGYDMPLFTEWLLTPYAGFGYRYLNDDTGGKRTTTGHYGYERESHYAYLPLGFDLEYEVEKNWLVRFNFECDVLIDGTQDSHLGDAVAGLSSVRNDQNDGYGLRGSLRLTKKREGSLDFFVEPFWRSWHIKDSDISVATYEGQPVLAGYEPDNKTTEFGLKMGILY